MILMVYNNEVCREILLPNTFDAEVRVPLRKEVYRLQKNIMLRMERRKSGLELVSSKDYRIRCAGTIVKRQRLSEDEIVEILTTDGSVLTVLVSEEQTSFCVTRNYDISGLRSISIGRSADNDISYSFQTLISSMHALIENVNGTWRITDRGRNGIFLSGTRIHGSHTLSFGDQIDVFGLHLIFMYPILMVGANCGELHVSEERLPIYEVALPDETVIRDVTKKQETYFNRSPRNLPSIYNEPVEIEAPPAPKIEKQKPTYMTIGPAFTMAIPMFLGVLMMVLASGGKMNGSFMYMGLVTAGGSAIIGVIWGILNLNYNREANRQEEELRFNAYSNYLMETAEKLRAQYQHNAAAMQIMYPSVSECLQYDRSRHELWNRNASHKDFLYTRIGLGDQPFQVEISIPKERFTLIRDTLSDRPAKIREEYRNLHNVPVGVDLAEHGLIGIVGGPGKRGAIDMMHVIAGGLAATHSYTDIKLVFIYDEEKQEELPEWECMRWFPHVWSEDKRIRYMAANEVEMRDVFFELSNVFRARAERAQNYPIDGERSALIRPHYVLFLHDPSVLENELTAKYIYEAKREYGLTTFLLVESLQQLPNVCEYVIENDQHGNMLYNLMEVDANRRQIFVPDSVSLYELEEFGKTLANIQVHEMESSSDIPSSLSFLDMFRVSDLPQLDVLGRWYRNRSYNTMKAVIGRKAGDVDCYLDIHEKFHGPHGLVAGTTGSGKSETLQTYILSLAVNFSPQDVSFFIIDFKGGGMANLFSALPHLAGQISNLSGNQVRRAMISIKSENTRRQRIFAEYGVNNINLYTQLYKNRETPIAIPHLFIIIDEFAELKREEPEFMQELISVAQVGRSLGVHLILATQKPSGTVDDNIWSNSKFRLCLRVQDRQDSLDMLHRPDAAFLTQAGRCFLQVGNDELFEQFQSGYSGAIYVKGGVVRSTTAMIGRTGRADLINSVQGQPSVKTTETAVRKQTQLEATIEYLSHLAQENGYVRADQLWMPVLPERLILKDLPGDIEAVYSQEKGWPQRSDKELLAPIGLFDDPANQRQDSLILDFAENGHLAVFGSVVSGKSTFLQTMIYAFITRYSPESLQMYLLDFSSHMLGAFRDAPHVGGVVSDGQEERLAKFFHLLTALMDQRKELLKGGNYTQYIRAYGRKIPALFIVIDNYAAFREKTGDKYEDIIVRLAREGVGYGIFFIVTAAGFGINELPSRIGDHIRTTISLEMQDKFKYMDVMRLSRVPILPESNVRGRGLAVVGEDVLEFQTALCTDAADDFARGQEIEKICSMMRQAWTGKAALPIPEIPANPELHQLAVAAGYEEALSDPLLLPIAYRMDDASVYSIRMAQNYCFVISGKSRSGKTNAMKNMIWAACKKGAEAVIVEKRTGDFSDLEKTATAWGTKYVPNSSELYQFFSELTPEFQRRNRLKQQLLREGKDEEEIILAMSAEKPIIIFIDRLSDFMDMVYKPDSGVGAMSGFTETILEKGRLHNISFVAGLKPEEQSLLMAFKAYQSFVAGKKGMHLGGNLMGQRLFSFQNIPMAQQSRTSKRGMAIVADDEEESTGIEVMIPLAKPEP